MKQYLWKNITRKISYLRNGTYLLYSVLYLSYFTVRYIYMNLDLFFSTELKVSIPLLTIPLKLRGVCSRKNFHVDYYYRSNQKTGGDHLYLVVLRFELTIIRGLNEFPDQSCCDNLHCVVVVIWDLSFIDFFFFKLLKDIACNIYEYIFLIKEIMKRIKLSIIFIFSYKSLVE